MEFLVFRRADSALVVVPSMFQPPLACGRRADLQPVGRCDLELEDFSAAAIADLGLHGFALIDGADLEVLRAHLQTDPASPGAMPDEPSEPQRPPAVPTPVR